jgi:hypothetical protein
VFEMLQLGDVQLLDEPYDHRRDVLEQLKPPDKNLVAITPAYSHADLSAIGMTPHGRQRTLDLKTFGRALVVGTPSGRWDSPLSRSHPRSHSKDWRETRRPRP